MSSELELKIAAIAKTWVGVPFVWGQASRAGCDCAGLLAGVLKEAGVLPSDFKMPVYSKAFLAYPEGDIYVSYLEKYFNKVEEPAVGRVLLFKLRARAMHAGILVEDDKFVAAHIHDGVLLVDFTSMWRNRLLSVWEVK